MNPPNQSQFNNSPFQFYNPPAYNPASGYNNWSFKITKTKDWRQSVYQCCKCNFIVTTEYIPEYSQKCFCFGDFKKIKEFPRSA